MHLGLGLPYWKRDQIDLATTEFREELKRSPSDPISNCLLVQIEMRQNNPDEAEKLFRTALEGNKHYGDALLGLG